MFIIEEFSGCSPILVLLILFFYLFICNFRTMVDWVYYKLYLFWSLFRKTYVGRTNQNPTFDFKFDSDLLLGIITAVIGKIRMVRHSVAHFHFDDHSWLDPTFKTKGWLSQSSRPKKQLSLPYRKARYSVRENPRFPVDLSLFIYDFWQFADTCSTRWKWVTTAEGYPFSEPPTRSCMMSGSKNNSSKTRKI